MLSYGRRACKFGTASAIGCELEHRLAHHSSAAFSGEAGRKQLSERGPRHSLQVFQLWNYLAQTKCVYNLTIERPTSQFDRKLMLTNFYLADTTTKLRQNYDKPLTAEIFRHLYKRPNLKSESSEKCPFEVRHSGQILSRGVKIIVTSDTVVKTSGREKNQPNFFGAKFLPNNFSPVKVREKDLLEILQSS